MRCHPVGPQSQGLRTTAAPPISDASVNAPAGRDVTPAEVAPASWIEITDAEVEAAGTATSAVATGRRTAGVDLDATAVAASASEVGAVMEGKGTRLSIASGAEGYPAAEHRCKVTVVREHCRCWLGEPSLVRGQRSSAKGACGKEDIE